MDINRNQTRPREFTRKNTAESDLTSPLGIGLTVLFAALFVGFMGFISYCAIKKYRQNRQFFNQIQDSISKNRQLQQTVDNQPQVIYNSNPYADGQPQPAYNASSYSATDNRPAYNASSYSGSNNGQPQPYNPNNYSGSNNGQPQPAYNPNTYLSSNTGQPHPIYNHP